MKKVWKGLGVLVLVIAVIIGGYAGYVFVSWDRIEDKEKLSVRQFAKEETLATDTTLRLVSANLGFGAYDDTYSFFMDGGSESRAKSEKAVKTNIEGSLESIQSLDPNLVLFQEVDVDGTRSWHVDEDSLIQKAFSDYSSTWAQNYDSPYLFWPLTQPHGKNQSGLTTLSQVQISSATRRSLPVEEGFSKFIDLDRCYSKQVIQTDTEHNLILYNVHLSAYTTDPSTANNQLKKLFKDMEAEYKKGSYVIAGGDFNKDLLGNSDEVFNKGKEVDENWAKPIDKDLIPESFQLVAPYDKEDPVPSCRNADAKYTKDTLTFLIDGFIVSDNISVSDAKVKDDGFQYSDHNPVYLDFQMKK